MKKTLLLALTVAALGVTTSAFAQVAGPQGGTPPVIGSNLNGKGSMKEREKITEEILAKLNLTPDQRTKIEAHRKEMAAQLLALRKGGKVAKGAGQTDETKEKIKAIRKENQQFMKQTLTKDQMKELARLRREEMQKLRSGSTTTSTTKP